MIHAEVSTLRPVSMDLSSEEIMLRCAHRDGGILSRKNKTSGGERTEVCLLFVDSFVLVLGVTNCLLLSPYFVWDICNVHSALDGPGVHI